jgi:hypothetical protein
MATRPLRGSLRVLAVMSTRKHGRHKLHPAFVLGGSYLARLRASAVAPQPAYVRKFCIPFNVIHAHCEAQGMTHHSSIARCSR